MKENIKGLTYAVKNNLSVKEMEVLLDFAQKDYNSTELAKHRNTELNTAHAIITKLKLKRLIEIKNVDKGFKIYTLK